jgi:dTDP-4-dehydrorhamnose reductase
MKKNVLILGATGMLGSAVYNVLKDRYNLILSALDKGKIDLLEEKYGGTKNHQAVEFDVMKIYDDFLEKKGYPSKCLTSFIKEIGEIDYIINAIGITIPYSLKNTTATFFINSAFPHILASCFGEKLIHITTDCVYDGKEGYPYNEKSLKNSVDVYGISKSLGEPTNALTIRTSIIGEELEGFNSLLEWFLKQKDQTISGFTKHYWNGVTTKEFGNICDRIMTNPDKYPKTGLYHVFSTTVSKYEMLLKFREKFNIDCVINKEEENKLDRTLSTIHNFNSLLNVPSFSKMIDELE